MAVDKLVDSTQLDADLTSVANAIRTKGGTSASLAFPAGFVSAVNAIPTGGGGGVNLDDFMNRTEPTGAVSLPTVSKLYGYAFYNHKLITSISAPSMTRLGAYDFGACSQLADVSMPELLYACSTDKADSIINPGDQCYAFASCHKLGNVHLPKFLKSGAGMFYRCGNDQSSYNLVIVLPAVTQLGNNACYQGKYKAVDLGPNLTALNNGTFYQSTVDVLILRSPTVVSAGNRDAVRYVHNIYVPSSLVSSYATATNWSTDAASRTVNPIEGSQYENYYADGTPIT